MRKFFQTDLGTITIIFLLFCIALPFFFLHQGLLTIDTGREFYLPQQIMNGEVLFKDIFNIYGALSYQVNAILFSIFSDNINTLYFAGIFNSLVILASVYFISREFLNKEVSFLTTLVVMFSLCFNTFLYNSNIPYAYAITYALSSFLLSVLFLIKYVKDTDKTKFAYLSCLFAGISLANKYEFTLYPLVLIYALGFLNPLGIKNGFKALGCFISIPFISYGILFLQGVNFEDIKNTTTLLNKLINSPILEIFFKKFGVFFDFGAISNLVKAHRNYVIFGFLPILNTITLGVLFKKIYEDKPLFILVVTSILACAKTFFFLNVEHMGAFILPIILISSVALLEKFMTNQKVFVEMALIISIMLFLGNDIGFLKYKDFKLETPKGTFYTFKKDGEPIKYVMDYILENTKNKDKVMVLPEGSFINYITDRKGDNFYYNLSPLFYFDVFGEKNIIKNFNNSEYIVILPINNIEYGYKYFGIDYAQNFYEMINSNYNLVKQKDGIEIFKRKNI